MNEPRMILWDGRDHPLFWSDTTWTCPNCKEVYEGAKHGIAEPCVAGMLGNLDNEWPKDSRHHWPSGMPVSLSEALMWSEIRARMREVDPDD